MRDFMLKFAIKVYGKLYYCIRDVCLVSRTTDSIINCRRERTEASTPPTPTPLADGIPRKLVVGGGPFREKLQSCHIYIRMVAAVYCTVCFSGISSSLQ